MMYAVTGKLCTINCDKKTAAIEDIPEQLYRQYLGLGTGYLTGTGAFIASRFMAFGKSL